MHCFGSRSGCPQTLPSAIISAGLEDPIKQLSQAAQYDPQCALAHTSLATIYMLNGVRGDAPEVTAAIACASKLSGGISEREQKHLLAAQSLASGEIIRATDIWKTF